MIPLIILNLAGCAAVDRPDTDICVVNAIDQHQKCYNLKKDYDDQGNLNKDAKPTFKPAASAMDLNKEICTDPQGWANFKVYIRELRREIGQKDQGK